MNKFIIDTAKKMCNNGTHSCKLRDLIEVTNATKEDVLKALLHAPFNCRFAKNINHITLLIIDNN